MAEILPLRAWRYSRELNKDIDSLVSPLFDVVSSRQRQQLYRNPLNSIHLNVPEHMGPAGAAELLASWKARGVLKQDHLYGIYVYYQYFRLHGSSRQYCRKGFIAHVRTHAWEDGVILRHENTIPNAVNDRIELLDKTKLHASATHGLYTDPDFELEKLMDLAIANPLCETEDYQGVRDVIAVIHDYEIVNRFIQFMAGKKIILADGHHRYEGSLRYLERSRAANPSHTGREPYNYHLMYFTNTEAEDLVILPTHRVIQNMASWNETDFLRTLGAYFHIREIDDIDNLNDVIAGKPWTFGLLLPEKGYRITLRPEVFESMNWRFPDMIKRLDLTVLHFFIIEKVLGIPGKDQRTSPNVTFDRSFSDCVQQVNTGKAHAAIITNEVDIEDVKRVCASGYTLPQKSTYFYPKVIAGLLFSSILDEEFISSHVEPF
ncbi:DUF1015 domain-containing protein [Chryseolinea sp. T2]|uniref:DUF1015 domain-containing protein n=1 Tax=Chryseolinea sp. T2 TaxID=3129255 RepID=UPI0030782640